MSLATATMPFEASDQATGEPGERLEIATRFGRVEIDARNVIDMPKGLHGFGQLRRFALLGIPGAEEGNFRLLQAIDDPAVGFVVLPLSLAGGLLQQADVDRVLDDLGVPAEHAAFLLLVTIRRGEDGRTAMTANLRAPVILDSERLTARQYIFANPDYPMRMPIAAA